jgi:hypothetical protein
MKWRKLSGDAVCIGCGRGGRSVGKGNVKGIWVGMVLLVRSGRSKCLCVGFGVGYGVQIVWTAVK